MLFKNILFYILKNKKQKTIFGCQTYFSEFFVLDNIKLFFKIITDPYYLPCFTIIIEFFVSQNKKTLKNYRPLLFALFYNYYRIFCFIEQKITEKYILQP